ncbi:MAG: response regulator [Anaerolineae bacterium]|nr:response regulator [Anaerolineae bacterium]
MTSQTNSLKQHPLHVLLLEDVPEDAVLIERQVKKVLQTYQFRVVDNGPDFAHALIEFDPDLILADYLVSQFMGDEALQVAQQQLPGIPFVFITGTLDNEELAAQTIIGGASGFVLKKHLNRLPNIILEILSGYSIRQKMAVKLHRIHQQMLQQQYEIAQYQREIAAMAQEMDVIKEYLQNKSKEDID